MHVNTYTQDIDTPALSHTPEHSLEIQVRLDPIQKKMVAEDVMPSE